MKPGTNGKKGAGGFLLAAAGSLALVLATAWAIYKLSQP